MGNKKFKNHHKNMPPQIQERKSLRQPLATLSSSAGAGPSTTSSNLNATLPLPVAQQPIGVGPDFGQLSKSDGYLGVNKENMDSAGQDVRKGSWQYK